MNKLFVVGDSFSAPPKEGDPFLPWYAQAAQQLNMNCLNFSGIGVSQDWCWWKMAQDLDRITTEDPILVVLTHPGRYWYFDDKPQMTNPNIVNIDRELTPDQMEAVKGYMMQIQRPPLDIQQLSHRLGWLQAQCQLRKLKPAQILCAFPLYIKTPFPMDEHVNWDNYSHIKISNGDLLTHVETPEMVKGLSEYDLWQGYDCRYNHMIKSNHKLLAETVAEAIDNQQSIDLMKPNWTKEVLDRSVFDNDKFIDQELDRTAMENRVNYLKTEFQKPWAQRSGLFDYFKKKNG